MQAKPTTAVQGLDSETCTTPSDSESGMQYADKKPMNTPDGRRQINLRVELQTMSALIDVLTTVTRVGGDIESVVATN